MSESVETEGVSAYQRFDCTGEDATVLAEAAEAARVAVEQGECIVLPTDTVYGIGADAFSAEAVQRLLDAKHRGRDMPPPVLIGDASLIRALATDVPESAKELIARHWPGPLTVICKIQPSLRMDLGETDGTIALRVPDHELAREVLRRTGPMAVSSANLSGRPAALTCDDAVEQLGESVAVYLDGGALAAGGSSGAAGAPSTIVDFSRSEDGEILRRGALSIDVLRQTVPALTDGTTPEPVPEPAVAPDLEPVDAPADRPEEDPNQPDLFADLEDEEPTDPPAAPFRTGHGSTAIQPSASADSGDPAPGPGPVS